MSSIEQISSSLPFGSSTASSPKSTSLAWRLVLGLWWIARWMPWYLWLMAGIWAYANYGRESLAPKRNSRRTVQSTTNNAGAPRRPNLTPRQPARSASPFTGINRSSPQLSRRSSYVRLPASEIRQSSRDAQREMQERHMGSPGHTPLGRPSVSSPQPAPQSTGSLPRLSSTGLRLPRPTSTSSLRHQVSISAPTLPLSARKRGRGDDEETEVKRSKLSESYHFDDTDEDGEGASAMELDDVAASKPSRGQKRGGPDTDAEEEDGAKRSRTMEPSESDEGEQQDSAIRKRQAAGSPSASGDENRSVRQVSHQGKKARRTARGVGSVRDKRGIEDVSREESEEEDQGYDSEGATRYSRGSTRNADSDVSEDEGGEAFAVDQSEGAGRAPSTVKRFRERARREGSADDDMMGDDLDSASCDAFSPAPSTGTPQKKRLSTAASAKKRLSSKSDFASRKSSSARSAVDAKLAAASRKSSDTSRKVGEEWTNYEGDRYRIDQDGVQRRLVEVRETRLKYKMPKDSKHPDAKATHEVMVERWVTAEEYEALLEQRKLAWQNSREDEERDRRAAEIADEGDTSMADAKASPQPTSKERGIYFATGVGTPLRSYSGLGTRLPSSSSLTNLAKLSNSPSSYSTLPNGRMRLPSSTSGSALAALATGSPRRKWSVNDVMRLLEDEDAAKAEREKRRQATLTLGEGDAAKAEAPQAAAASAKVSTNETEGKIKLANYTLPASSIDPSAGEKARPTPSFTLAPSTTPKTDAAAPASTASSSKPAGVPNFFGAALGSTAKDTPTKPEPAPTASKPAFGFGSAPAPAAATEAAPQKADTASKPAFSFGSAPLASAPAPADKADKPASQPTFSFGAPAAKDVSAEKREETAAPAAAPSFLSGFGAPSGSASTAPAPSAASEAPKPSFSFGSAPISSTTTSEFARAAPAGGFSFGSSTSAAATEKKEDATAKPTFAFGSTSTATTEQPTAAPSFGSGATAARAPAKLDDKPVAASPFSFGTAPAQTDKPAVPAFGFGPASNVKSDLTNAAAPAAASSFSFGNASTTAPAPSSTPTGGFSFGAPASSAPSATSSGFSFGAPAAASPAPSSTGFSLGAAPAVASPAAAPSTGFSFGNAPAAPLSGGFSFGAPAASTAPGVSPSTGTFNFGAAAPTSSGAQSAGGTPMFCTPVLSLVL
ncbi:hypothetical protein Rt10032_c05g2502 [Rhodotorula toruloides]|uniref:Uncharacterized protein n=1 Tax=Rhodotorula toruloides TaxID=5286 RepID=A0A511KET5_RHOTO|nr:hypothetical protein Rt10032_c05g2502 [Rhodotorula toruloides]